MTKLQALNKALLYLQILKQVYEQEAMPSMIDSGDGEDRIRELEKIIRTLGKTQWIK